MAVSATPGKTKHFQTLVVSDSLLLCDCPGESQGEVEQLPINAYKPHTIMTVKIILATGLVFPSFMRSAGEMLCAGILPYNQIMRDYTEPAAVIAARVPMYLLEVLLLSYKRLPFHRYLLSWFPNAIRLRMG